MIREATEVYIESPVAHGDLISERHPCFGCPGF